MDIEKAMAGDIKAYERIVSDYENFVLCLCESYLKNRELAQDATQEIFVRVFRQISSLENPRLFPAWIKRLAINYCLDELRRKRPSFIEIREELLERDITKIPEMTGEDFNAERLIYSHMTSLNDDHREIIKLYYLWELKLSQVSEKLNISVDTAKKRLQRARDALRKEIKTMGKEGEQKISKKVAELLSRQNLIEAGDTPVKKMLERFRGALAGYDYIEGEEILDTKVHQPLMPCEWAQTIYVDDSKALRSSTTSSTLSHLQKQPDKPTRVWTAGRVWRDATEDKKRLKMFHQLDLLEASPHIHECDIIGQVTDIVEKVLPGKRLLWESDDIEITKRCWVLYVENNGSLNEIAAGGEFKDDLLRHYGIDPKRQKVLGIGFGLERMAMAAFGIEHVKQTQIAYGP